MRKLSCCFAPILLLAACHSTPNVPSKPAAVADSPAPTAVAIFPESWFGRYAGPATLHVPQDKLKDFWMELNIRPLAGTSPPSYMWQIIYAESREDAAATSSDTRQVRDFRLVEADAGRGRFNIDEGDGRVIPCAYIGDELWSFFEVEQTTLAAAYRKAPNGDIEYTIITHPSQPAPLPPATQDKGVSAWLPTSMQHATLNRE